MFQVNPKYDWLLSQITSGNTVVLGNEDDNLWKAKDFGVWNTSGYTKSGMDVKNVILGETLQQQDDPVKYLKEVKQMYPNASLHLTVPNEYSWDPKFKPFTNPKHKKVYDVDSLATDLESAGLTYNIGTLDFKGWAFFVVVCS